MLEELRLNPRAAAARSQVCCAGVDMGRDGGAIDPKLSTTYARGRRLRSTGALHPIHRGVAIHKEEVG
jgi:hypothetical protein